MGGTVAAGALLFSACVSGAAADPAGPPTSASDAVARLMDLSHQSEQLNQQALAVQEDLNAKQAAADAADAKEAQTKQAADVAQADVAQRQPAFDRAVIAAYEGTHKDPMFSLMVSRSPQQMLDQMSTLNMLSTQAANRIGVYKKADDAADVAESAAKKAADAAHAAADAVAATQADLERRRADLQGSMAQVIEAWGQLSRGDQDSLSGALFPPGFDRETLLSGLVPGSGTSALAAALTRVGDPYVWGATGPDQFDCSGLVQWAFHHVGINLPRTSQQQATVGMPVDRDSLQPGDVVFFYSDASHVGIYAGNGMLLHASTFGVPVQVAPMGSTPFYGARRYRLGMQ
ncbi:NlpC/P60 family protein [Nocardia stercoris]|uniref:NlpC/P60 family protein n=1 Tax=Nocardia stercoris TaxID=2483361 RepID=A0A3M2L052_9NOCA|nr:NlpC/P60 family protein [Nocardia stercoris]